MNLLKLLSEHEGEVTILLSPMGGQGSGPVEGIDNPSEVSRELQELIPFLKYALRQAANSA